MTRPFARSLRQDWYHRRSSIAIQSSALSSASNFGINSYWIVSYSRLAAHRRLRSEIRAVTLHASTSRVSFKRRVNPQAFIVKLADCVGQRARKAKNEWDIAIGIEDCQKSRGNLDMKWIMYAMHLPFRGSGAATRGDVAGDREGWMQIAVLPHVTANADENDRERPLYSARLGVGTRSVHKYRVQRRHQQFIAIISGVLTALSAYAERLENGLG
ncbi:hypothetical protein ALC56_06160 [Trachymyrmex septentrionalis]|uniref:Uncharacterized protein n=1 Tax=Trachymyrmex septentrionalis TaxID=34720 RepID=A0A195FG47_9HYME|nr:hypothetical protein ALC56_06160 [Trachymyrmex septentrionalis]